MKDMLGEVSCPPMPSEVHHIAQLAHNGWILTSRPELRLSRHTHPPVGGLDLLGNQLRILHGGPHKVDNAPHIDALQGLPLQVEQPAACMQGSVTESSKLAGSCHEQAPCSVPGSRLALASPHRQHTRL